MRKSNFWQILALGCVATLCVAAEPLCAQEPRLRDRVPDAVRSDIDAVLDSARVWGIPTEPLVDRALEGASKGAGGDLILRAVRRLADELLTARDALGAASTNPEIVAGASALRAGAEPADLRSLRELRQDQPLTIAAAVLADLVAVGVPADTATSAVIALAVGADDVEYIAFRRNVERDITLGASPVAALGVRLGAAADALELAAPGYDNSATSRRPRKP